jgi:hypothetical protein
VTRAFAAMIAITASVGAGVIHVALGPEHIEELGALGWGFAFAAALQIGWAVVALAMFGDGRQRAGVGRLAAWGIAINIAILGAWAISRTVGLPVGEGRWVAEPIGRTDSITAALEVTVIAAALVLRRARHGALAARARLAPVLASFVIAAATVIALAPGRAHAATHEATSDAGSMTLGVEGGQGDGQTSGHDHTP